MRIPALNSFVGVLIFFLLFCGLASATEYFVSPDGTGNGLSIDTPGDPSAIAPLLVAGDKMYCRGGTYTNEIIDLVSSGTSENHITIQNYQNEIPIFNGTISNTYVTDDALYIPVGSNYIDISGITIQNYNTTNGIFCNGNYCTISDCTIDTIGYNTSTTVGRLLCRDGSFIGNPVGRDPQKFSVQPLLMPYTSILPENFSLKDRTQEILQPPCDRVVIGETQNTPIILNINSVVMGSVNAWDYVQEDVLGRETFGIYGSSLLDPIELSIRNLLNINKGFVSFVKRYGMGRYHYDHVMLQKLVEDGVISPEKAGEIHASWLENNKNLSENEDISSVGMKITPIDAKGSLNVQEFKESLETEIQLGLFQSPLTMGKAAGTTYASGYLVEEDRLVVLEGLQKIHQNLVTQIVNKRLSLMGKPEDSVAVKFEELSKIKLTASEVQEMYNTGVIERDEFRKWGGFYLLTDENET
jgi:hypothetical protein